MSLVDAGAFIRRLCESRHYRDQIAAMHTLDARPAQYAEPSLPMPAALRSLLARLGIERLYSHQAVAYDAARRRESLVVCSGTASGKSLCFHLPVMAELIDDPEATALYLFPSKALAYDQLGTLERMVVGGRPRRARAGGATARATPDDDAARLFAPADDGGGDSSLLECVRPACYDGDTPTHKRAAIRRSANLILSNPDMLHVSILPYHAKWAAFLARLKYVVLDEIHMYRGIFGSHVAGVVRRLERLCRHYGAEPTFICCSATLGNPRELAERLIGRPVKLIDFDGSPRGRKHFVLWNPPWLDATRVGRRSGNVEAQELMQKLIEAGAGTIAFAKARVVAELLYKYVRDALAHRRPDLARRIRPYRGGYLPIERREIEQALFSGELLGVCSTNALELGIDVGSLDAAILVGFPGTFCSFWQQAGRAGRRQDESLVVFIAYDDPIDQFLVRRADFLFSRPLEQAVVDPENPQILAAQLSCAAAELPLEPADAAAFGAFSQEVCGALEEDGKLRHTQGRFYWSSPDTPAARTNLRTISNATYAIVDITGGRNEVLGQVDSISAPELVYPEAIYLHQAESYVVRELDQELRLARVERLEADYYTQPILASEIRIRRPLIEEMWRGGRRCFGDVTVKWQTIAFKKIKFYTMEVIGQTSLDLEPQYVHTSALWLQPAEHVLKAVASAGHKPLEGLAGARNVMMVTLPALAMCDRYDLGGIVDSSNLGVPNIFLYDRYEGGVGYARLGFEHCDELLRLAYELVAGCPCEDGCPGCIGPPNLRVAIHHDPDVYRQPDFPDKAATVCLLEEWLRT